MRMYVSLLFVLTFVSSAFAQLMPKSSAAKRATAQQLSSISETYSDTLGMLKTWLDTEKNADLGRLFVAGDSRASDLTTACQNADDEIAAAAFITLQLLGKSESQSCADSLSQRQSANGGLVLGCAGDLSDADFKRVEEWLAKKRTRNGYECGDPEETLVHLDDAVIYALILDGSPRSKLAIARLLRFEKACTEASTITAEILLEADLLIGDAKRIGHNLRFEPDSMESVIRTSAFFLPRDYRKDSSVELIAYNKTGDRVLLQVSYHCGLLCGKGYYVVLRKDGTTWQYALIRMAWIS